MCLALALPLLILLGEGDPAGIAWGALLPLGLAIDSWLFCVVRPRKDPEGKMRSRLRVCAIYCCACALVFVASYLLLSAAFAGVGSDSAALAYAICSVPLGLLAGLYGELAMLKFYRLLLRTHS